jgi:anti-sigma regulatory factor (Ser/Thr protein kinase)
MGCLRWRLRPDAVRTEARGTLRPPESFVDEGFHPRSGGHPACVMPSNSLRQCLCATPDAVPLARQALCEFVREHCSEAPDIADPVALTVSEAVGNAVRHAYPGRQDGPVEVEAEVEDDDLVVYVRDQGVGIENRSADPGLGLGMVIMRQLARFAIAARPGGGTQVSLRFRCHP